MRLNFFPLSLTHRFYFFVPPWSTTYFSLDLVDPKQATLAQRSHRNISYRTGYYDRWNQCLILFFFVRLLYYLLVVCINGNAIVPFQTSFHLFALCHTNDTFLKRAATPPCQLKLHPTWPLRLRPSCQYLSRTQSRNETRNGSKREP